jgi:hypothetical protein
VAFLRRLASLIPPPRQNQIRFYGLLASQAHDRPKLEALFPGQESHAQEDGLAGSQDIQAPGPDGDNRDDSAQSSRGAVHRIAWAKLLARVFATDVLRCPNCGGQRKILAWITEPGPIKRILHHMGLPTEVPSFQPARGPPQLGLFGSAAPRG